MFLARSCGRLYAPGLWRYVTSWSQSRVRSQPMYSRRLPRKLVMNVGGWVCQTNCHRGATILVMLEPLVVRGGARSPDVGGIAPRDGVERIVRVDVDVADDDLDGLTPGVGDPDAVRMLVALDVVALAVLPRHHVRA